MHVSAAVKLIPMPPARVLKRKTGMEELLLNSSIISCRSLMLVLPSKRRNARSNDSIRQPRRSIQSVHWEKMRIRWPFSINSGRSTRSLSNLGDENKSCSCRRYRPSSSRRSLFSSMSSVAAQWIPKSLNFSNS